MKEIEKLQNFEMILEIEEKCNSLTSCSKSGQKVCLKDKL